MNISAIAKDLVPLLGGSENIVSAAHCATRLRLVLADDSKVNKAAIDKLDGVKGCFSNAGQIQVIFGTGLVNKVYAEFVTLTGTGTSTDVPVPRTIEDRDVRTTRVWRFA